MTPETAVPAAAEPGAQGASDKPAPNPITRLARAIGKAARFPGDPFGLGTGDRAALARMDVDAIQPHQYAALARALIQADLDPEHWRPETWRRWAQIAQGMALVGHQGSDSLGRQLSHAGVAEPRVTKLLTARGDAFDQLLPPLLRLLASKEAPPNWHELGGLILNHGKDEERAEQLRMKIASRYFSEQAKKAVKD